MATQQQIYLVLRAVGASPDEARTLSAIAMAESGGRLEAHNPNGENSRGWYQINLDAHGSRIDAAGTHDPTRSSQYALQLFRSQGPRPWSVTHERVGAPYRQYLGTQLQEPAALPRTGGDPMQEPTPGIDGNPPPGGAGGEQPKLQPGQVIQDASGKQLSVINVDPATGHVMVADLSTVPPKLSRLSAGTYTVPGINKAINVGQDGTVYFEGAPSETDPAISGEGVPYTVNGVPIPGLFVNPNTGAIIDMTDSSGPTQVDPTVIHPTVTGSNAPDPVGAGNLLLDLADAKLDQGKYTADQLAGAWERAFEFISTNADIDTANVTNKLSADKLTAELVRDYMLATQSRASNIATAQGNLNNEATRRSQIISQDILPRSLPEGVGLNLPGVGNVPLNNVNIEELMNQGLPSLGQQFGDLQSLFPAVGEAPTVTAGTVNPLDSGALPEVPFLPPPQLPDPAVIQRLADQAARGSPGFTQWPQLMWPQII